LKKKAAVYRAKDWYFCLLPLKISLLSEMAIKSQLPIFGTGSEREVLTSQTVKQLSVSAENLKRRFDS
jgi:hypothetical protein